MDEFHFLRPYWFVLLLPAGWLIWRAMRRTGQLQSAWRAVVDPALQGQLQVVEKTREKTSRWPLAGLVLVWLLVIVALAGPTWEREKTQLYRQRAERVLVVDLSRSMNATDIKPSRIERAKQKLNDILQLTREEQNALIVFSVVPYVVTPLTDDIETIRSMLPALSTELLPAQGSRPALAIRKAVELLQSAQSSSGDIWLLTDAAVNEKTLQAAEYALQQGFRLSTIGVGTIEGAPLPNGAGGYVKDRKGNIVVPKLDESGLRRLAQHGGGHYSRVATNDSDLNQLFSQIETPLGEAAESDRDQLAELWKERGPWLLWAVLPIAAVGFRRGWLT